MARRPLTLKERQKVIRTALALWFQMVQQYMMFLSNMEVALSLIENNLSEDPVEEGESSSGQKRTEDFFASIKLAMDSIHENITKTTKNIERLTNSLPKDVARKREYMVDKLNHLPGISYTLCVKAIRMLKKDHADLETFIMMPDDQTKVDFILSILE